MNHRDTLQVDLANLQDIREKLPQAQQLYRSKVRQLEALASEVRQWESLISTLSRLVGEPVRQAEVRVSPAYGGGEARAVSAPRSKAAPGQERAVRALERFGHPTGPSELFRYMLSEDMDAPANANALGANLWSAARAGRIKKTRNGQYAPLDWGADQNELTSSNREGEE